MQPAHSPTPHSAGVSRRPTRLSMAASLSSSPGKRSPLNGVSVSRFLNLRRSHSFTASEEVVAIWYPFSEKDTCLIGLACPSNDATSCSMHKRGLPLKMEDPTTCGHKNKGTDCCCSRRLQPLAERQLTETDA